MKTNRLPTMAFRIIAGLMAVILNGSIHTLAIQAQDTLTGAFAGLIVDDERGAPIATVSVELVHEATKVTVISHSDKQGRFFQGLLMPGLYTIRFTSPRFRTRVIKQRLFANRINEVVPVPVELERVYLFGGFGRVARGRLPTPAKNSAATGGLAVAALPNAVIRVEAIGSDLSQNALIPPDQSLIVFNDLNPKVYRVIGNLEGYLPAQADIEVKASKTSGVTLKLTPNEPSTLKTVVEKYYALVMGTNDYKHLPHLQTAERDAQVIATILREEYGFETKLLLNASREQIVVALNEYRRTLDQNANLLIYYAGHGYNDKEVEKAYWLPVDARKGDNANWISADDVTTNVKGITAKQVLIVSDSCYSGTLARGIEVGISEPVTRNRYLQKMLNGKSRTLMASGGNEPVADGGGEGHSVFARAFINGLNQMDRDMFTAEEIYYNFIREAVTGKSNQAPEYNPLRNSGHESGDFVFVRRRKQSAMSYARRCVYLRVTSTVVQ